MNYTYSELKKTCDEFFESLSEDAKYHFMRNCDITLDMYVLSSIRPGDIVNIDYYSNTWEIINSNRKKRERKEKINRLIK